MANHGETDIDKLIAGMKPKLNEGDYVFCLVSNDSEIYNSKISRKDILMEFKETEGITLILKKNVADKYADDGLRYEYVAAWLTLEIHSALEAVGLTAAVSKALAEANISAKLSCVQL